MQDFRNLRVWRAAHAAALTTYRVSAAFPEEERFGLTSQIRRSASSVAANIAEGCGRSSDADTRRCLQLALGEACETLNHALEARDLGFLDEQSFTALEAELSPVRRMLIRLIERMESSSRGRR